MPENLVVQELEPLLDQLSDPYYDYDNYEGGDEEYYDEFEDYDVNDVPNIPVADKVYPTHGCFGFVDGNLIIGNRHHQEIMALLIDKGWTWTDLMEAEQIWGWYSVCKGASVKVNFVSDAAFLHKAAAKKCRKAFSELFDLPCEGKYKLNNGDVKQRHPGLEYGGDYDRHYAEGSDSLKWVKEHPTVISDIPDPPQESK